MNFLHKQIRRLDNNRNQLKEIKESDSESGDSDIGSLKAITEVPPITPASSKKLPSISHRNSRFEFAETPKVVTKQEKVYISMLEKMRSFPDVYTYFQNKSQHIIKPKKVYGDQYYKKYMEPALLRKRKYSRRCISLEPNLGRARSILPPLRKQSQPTTPESISQSFQADGAFDVLPPESSLNHSQDALVNFPQRSNKHPPMNMKHPKKEFRRDSKLDMQSRGSKTSLGIPVTRGSIPSSALDSVKPQVSKHLGQKKEVKELDVKDARLKDVFRKVTQKKKFHKSNQCTPELLKEYLLKRYSTSIVEAMMQHMHFDYNGDFEDFCKQLNKIIFGTSEWQTLFVMDLYDTNNDKYVCQNDVFNVMKHDAHHVCPTDVAMLNQQFAIKRLGGPAPKKRKGLASRSSMSRASNQRGETAASNSTSFSNMDHDGKVSHIANKRGVPYRHPNKKKKEALAYEDMTVIDFDGGKPAILNDFCKYMTGKTIFKQLNIAPPTRHLERKTSEERLFEGRINWRMEDPYNKLDYYAALKMAMDKYSNDQSKWMLQQFGKMQDNSVTAQCIISEGSMVQGFKAVFGIDCPHLARRFFDVLQGSKHWDVTKIRFLNRLLKVFRGDRKVRLNFAFKLYNIDRSEKLSSNEVSSMLYALPEDLPLYVECMNLVDDFIKRITTTKDSGMSNLLDYHTFCQLLQDSMLVKYLIDGLTYKKPEPIVEVRKSRQVKGPRRPQKGAVKKTAANLTAIINN